jgi:hypothetical protein
MCRNPHPPDPNVGTSKRHRWYLLQIYHQYKDTFGLTQDGITGVVKRDFRSESYHVGWGHERRSAAWEHYVVNGEPLTRLRTHNLGGAMREAELLRGSRSETDGLD